MKKGKFGNLWEQILEEFPSDLSSKTSDPFDQEKRKASYYKKQHDAKKARKKSSKKNQSFYANTSTRAKNQAKKQAKPTYVAKAKEEKVKKNPPKINPTKEEMRKAVIYAEILGKPKALR